MSGSSGSMSVRLSVRGKPSAFDLSPSNDMAVVASPGCLTLFSLNALGAPRHIIHYEQPQQIRKVKCQKEGKLAALRGGVVSFWDPLHSLRPLLGVVQSTGWIADMDWSNGNSNMIATACVQGDIKLFDIRAPQTAAQSTSVAGACNSVSWCPCRPNFIASSSKDTVFIWDTRMLPITGNKDLIHSGDNVVHSNRTEETCNICPTEGIQHMTWASSESPCLVTVSTSGLVTWWNGINGANETSCECPPMGSDSIVLPSPVGKGLVSTQREDPMLLSQPLAPSQIFPHISSTDLPTGVGSETQQKLKFLSTTLERLDQSQVMPTSVWINGYPRREFSLMSLYDPKATSTDAGGRLKTYRHQMALSPEPILGMKWGTAGRLLPHMNGGLELILLTAETACLHAVALSPDAVNKYCDDGSLERSRAARQQQQQYNHDHNRTAASSKEFKTSLKMNPPRYSITGLKRSLLTPSVLLGNKDVVVEESQATHTQSLGGFWGQLQHEILVLEEALQKGHLSGLSIGRIDQYARQITLEMTKPITSEQSVVIRGGDGNSSSDDVDGDNDINEDFHSESKSSHVAVSWPPESTTILPDELEKSQVAILIVSFPAKFPIRGLPTFTVRSLFGTKVDNNGAVVASLESELLSVAKSALKNEKAPTLVSTHLETNRSNPNLSGFLLDAARCFRNRALQVWGAPGVSVDEIQEIVCAPLPASLDESTHGDRDMEDDDSNMVTAASNSLTRDNSHSADDELSHSVIDPLAYKVPCPVSSGGIFSYVGNLTCFGGSTLSFNLVVTSSKMPTKKSTSALNDTLAAAADKLSTGNLAMIADSAVGMAPSSEIYPKTYADLLLRLREAKQMELASKMDGSIDGKPGRGMVSVESNARLGGGLNSGPFYEQFFQNMRDMGSDSLEDGSDYGDDVDTKSNTDESSSGMSSHDLEDAMVKASRGNSSQLGEPSHESSSRMLSPTTPYAVLTRSFVEELHVLGEELDRNHELGGYKPSSHRVPAVVPAAPGPMNFPAPPKVFHSFLNPSFKSAQVLIFGVYGDKRQKLAEKYSFGMTRDFQQSTSSQPTFRSLTRAGNSDPSLVDQTKKSVTSIGQRSGSMNNLLEAHGALSQYKINVMDDSNVQMVSLDGPDFQQLGSRAGGSGRLSPFDLGDSQHGQSKIDNQRRGIRNGADIASTCRFNATLAASLADDSLANMWLLLGVCFDMLVITGYLDEAFETEDGKESCRRMVKSGLLRDWSKHALGRPLLSRVFTHLAQMGDLQTMATITCICGGAKATALLLGEAAVHTPLSLDRILLRYADILHRWQCHVQATEVSKYVSRTVSSMVHLTGVEGLSNSSIVSLKLGLYCPRCGREVMPWGPSGGGGSSKGPWCTSCSGFALQCTLCEQVMRGYGYFCPQCGHGGHPHHMKKWFETNAECPTGCGCRCGDLGFQDEEDGVYDSSGEHKHGKKPSRGQSAAKSDSSRTISNDMDSDEDDNGSEENSGDEDEDDEDEDEE